MPRSGKQQTMVFQAGYLPLFDDPLKLTREVKHEYYPDGKVKSWEQKEGAEYHHTLADALHSHAVQRSVPSSGYETIAFDPGRGNGPVQLVIRSDSRSGREWYRWPITLLIACTLTAVLVVSNL